jgi:hypothetical protein
MLCQLVLLSSRTEEQFSFRFEVTSNREHDSLPSVLGGAGLLVATVYLCTCSDVSQRVRGVISYDTYSFPAFETRTSGVLANRPTKINFATSVARRGLEENS